MKKILVLAVLLSIVGCAPTTVQQQAAMVRLTHEEPEPEKCVFLGDVTGSQGDPLTGLFTTSSDLETGARNDIKNRAMALGGNVVYLLTERAAESSLFTGETEQVSVTLSGNVYRCD